MSNYYITEGWHKFYIKAVNRSGEWSIGYDNGLQFYYNPSAVTPTPDPEPDPTPRAHPMTVCRIDKIEIATDTSVTVKVTVNGYGKVVMNSVTLKQAGFGSDLAEMIIKENDYDLQTNGYKTFEMSYRLEGYYKDVFSMYGERGLPLGTVELLFTAPGFWRSLLLLSIGQYFYRTYNGTYSTTIKPRTAGYSVAADSLAVTPLSSVKLDWQLLINVFYYLSSTTQGALKMGSRADYIPRSGDVLTADMYNGLIDIARSCLNQIKYKYADGYWLNPDLPNKVYSGQIIPKDFISVLGNAANEMVGFVQKQTNKNVEGVWR